MEDKNFSSVYLVFNIVRQLSEPPPQHNRPNVPNGPNGYPQVCLRVIRQHSLRVRNVPFVPLAPLAPFPHPATSSEN